MHGRYEVVCQSGHISKRQLLDFFAKCQVDAPFHHVMEGGVLSSSVVALSGGLLCINILLCMVVNRLEQNRLTEEEKQKLQTEAAHNLEPAKTYQDSFNHG